MGYPLDCRVCGGYEYHKADCALEAERTRDEERAHRERMERLAVESRRERIAVAALQGLIAGTAGSGYTGRSVAAVAYADALNAPAAKESLDVLTEGATFPVHSLRADAVKVGRGGKRTNANTDLFDVLNVTDRVAA